MTVVPRSVVCDRVRGQVSLRLDGEVSQLESRMVDAHLARCVECREFAAGISDVTEALRSAPLERLMRPVAIRRLRHASLSRAQVSMVAAVAVAVLGALTQLGGSHRDPARVGPTRFESSQQLSREVEQIISDGRAFSQHAGPVTPI
jgi:predicted anti-sigma-YlaC factor YlaD